MCAVVFGMKEKTDQKADDSAIACQTIPGGEIRQAQAARVTPPNTRQGQKAPIGLAGMVLICMVCVGG